MQRRRHRRRAAAALRFVSRWAKEGRHGRSVGRCATTRRHSAGKQQWRATSDSTILSLSLITKDEKDVVTF